MPSIEIIAPSRLHFGLLSFGQPTARQFGGAGVMISQPGLRLLITQAEQFVTSGPLSERVAGVVERYRQLFELPAPPACRIEIVSAPPGHVGLGSGTQLALSVVAGLNAFRGGEPLLPSALATIAGRGTRSAIGTYGFVYGGLLVEAGKLPRQLLAPLERRVEINPAWRFVLVTPAGERGLSGEAERDAFDDLPPVPRSTTARLLAELADELLPAAAAGEFERFSESLYRYGHAAGMCFAPRHGGPFASRELADLVRMIREMGVRGVGQSSWGPTIFAAFESDASARAFCERLSSQLGPDATLTIAEPNNTGAKVTVQP